MNYTEVSEEDVDMLIPAQVARQNEEKAALTNALLHTKRMREDIEGEEISRPRPVYVEEGKMKILTSKMEVGVFYLVSYMGEKYAVRKLDENRVEFREVEE